MTGAIERDDTAACSSGKKLWLPGDRGPKRRSRRVHASGPAAG